MGFLLRRNRPRAYARWFDKFKRSESPIQKPWAQWGAPRTVAIDEANGMILYSDTGWFTPNPDGGVAYEHQPFTPNWGVEFTIKWNLVADGALYVVFDSNWTKGASAADTRYQVQFIYARQTTYTVTPQGLPIVYTTIMAVIECRDKNSWNMVKQYSAILTDTEWAELQNFKVLWFDDYDFVIIRNNKTIVVNSVYSENYRIKDSKRASNFKNMSPQTLMVKDFTTYDREFLARPWTEVFADNFNRTSIANGWTVLNSSRGAGIVNNTFQKTTGNDGYVAIIRPATRDLQIQFTISGQANTVSESAVLFRMTPDGVSGLACYFHDDKVRFCSVTRLPSGTNGYIQTVLTNDLKPPGGDLKSGEVITISIIGDEAWMQRNGRLLCFAIGLNAKSPAGAVHAGLMVRRTVFFNSSGFDDLVFRQQGQLQIGE